MKKIQKITYLSDSGKEFESEQEAKKQDLIDLIADKLADYVHGRLHAEMIAIHILTEMVQQKEDVIEVIKDL